MKQLITVLVFSAACGGSSDKKTTPDQPPATSMEGSDSTAMQPAPTPDPPKAEPPPAPAPPPPPQVWKARADLAPVKGAKQKAAAIVFTQTEGQTATSVTSDGWFDGLAPGKYHLVIHEAAACGPNATKVGKAWAGAATVPLGFEVTKESPGNIDAGVPLKVDGDAVVTGHTLVLYADKKGKPGKALACGPIAAPAADAAPKTP